MKRILLMTFVLLLAVFCFASCKQGGNPSGSTDGSSEADVTGTGKNDQSGSTSGTGGDEPGTTSGGKDSTGGTTVPGDNTTINNNTSDKDTTKTTATKPGTTKPGQSDDDLTEDEKYYKKKAAGFKNSDFGGLKSFTSPFKAPSVVPTKGQHPRVMVNESTLPKLRKALSASENENAVYQFTYLAEKKVTTGTFGSRGSETSNADRTIMCAIEAKAYKYLLTGEKVYGYQAIYALKNAILTIDAEGMADPYRDYGILMYISACVYDWCHDLLTETDMEQITAGVLNKLGARMEIGCPPSKDGAIAHHNLECQLLRSYLSFAIATYDEYPFIYNYVVGRLYNDIVPAQNFMLQSGKHWEGSGYGPSRTYYLMWGQMLMSAMTNGKTQLFSKDDLYKVCNTMLDFLYPGSLEGHPAFELGDQCNSSLGDFYMLEFFAGNYFKDKSLKGFSQLLYDSTTNDYVPNKYSFAWISPVTYLIINDAELKSTDWWQGRKLVNMLNFPGSAVFARSSWTDPNAAAVYMNMTEFYSCSHSHMECGSFQIYYKGILASDSGKYDGYGSTHHYAYTVQTISSNSLLIFNSDKVKALSRTTHPYSGGQSVVFDLSRYICSYTLEAAKKSKSMNQSTVIGRSYKVDGNTYKYSYLAGDMTKAYDAVTVDEVTRHMMSVMTDNKTYPMVFVTFDRVTADDASYKKTVLLHSKTKPEVTSNGYVIVKNGGGKLVAQSLITDMKATVLGGDGSEYTVNGTVYKPSNYNSANAEYRVDLNPVKANKTDRMLTLMYVTDATNSAAPVKAKEINTDTLAGAEIFNRAILFAKEQGELTGTHSFKLSGDAECYIGGVKAGKWQVTSGGKTETVTVQSGEGLLTFTASAGTVEVSYVG